VRPKTQVEINLEDVHRKFFSLSHKSVVCVCTAIVKVSLSRLSISKISTMAFGNSRAPKYDLTLNPIYQVDWHNEAAGKRLSATKRRVRWRFGFSNAEALREGYTGVDCRGEEHEVVLVWSLASGKRLVLVDGQEVHFSYGRRTDAKFEATWSMFGNHIFKVVGYAAPPLFNEPGFRQFDFLVDGMSFFSFPRIFQLGNQKQNTGYNANRSGDRMAFAQPPSTPRNLSTSLASAKAGQNQPHMPTPHRVAETRMVVTEDLLSSPSTESEKDLLWSSAPQLNYSNNTSTPSLAPQRIASEVTNLSSAQMSQPPLYSAAAAQPAPIQSPRGVMDEFAPVPPSPKTFKDVSAEILNAYAPSPSLPALMYQPYYTSQVYDASSALCTTEDVGAPSHQTSAPAVPILKPTMQPMSVVEMEERDEPPLSEMEKAVKSLVNLTDITETLETPEQVKSMRNKGAKESPKSKALPPTTPDWSLGLRPSLADIKERTQHKARPQKQIMRTHAFDPAAAQAGMMVLYGQTSYMQPPMVQHSAAAYSYPRRPVYTAY
jgi:hypothetical protein